MHRSQSPTALGITPECSGTPGKLLRSESDELPAIYDDSSPGLNSVSLRELDFGSGAASQHSSSGRLFGATLDLESLPGEGIVASGSDLSPAMSMFSGADMCDDANGDTNPTSSSDPVEAEHLDPASATESSHGSTDAGAILASLNPDLDEEELQMLAECGLLLEAHAPTTGCPDCHGIGRDRIGLTCLLCRGCGRVRLERPPGAFPAADVTNHECREPARVVAMAANLHILTGAIKTYALAPEAFLMPFSAVYPEPHFLHDFDLEYLPNVLVQPDDQMDVLESMLLPGRAGEGARARVELLLRWSQPDFYTE